MILIESKYFCIRPPDRAESVRAFAVAFVLVAYVMGGFAVGDASAAEEVKIGNMHRTERYVRDTGEKSAEIDGVKQTYQSYREGMLRFPEGRSSGFVDADGFAGKPSEKLKPAPLTSRVVRTKYGDVSGVIISPDSRHLEPVEVFRGIPYAMPPTGNLRFMPPVSSALWSGVKIADKFSPVCPQRLPDISNETLALKRMPKGRLEYLKRLLPHLQNQSEDCLYLNIYAPAQAGARESTGSTKYPVLLFVHGESYEWNSGNPYDGSVLASYGGVVVVTINYRLGILGFLNLNTDAYLRSPANYGLMDQIAALHWIQENIAVFGGDPTNVTVLGHGTGAACVNLLMTSSAVPDGLLFHRAILMSGSALGPWALVQNPTHYAHQVARHANCSPDLPHPHLLKCLRDRPLDALLSTPIETPDFTPVFGPSVDGVVIDNEPEPADESGPRYRYGDSGNYNEMLSSATGKGGQQLADNVPGGINTLNSVLLRKSVVSRLSRYDLLLGVVRAESYFAFNGEDVQYGIEGDRRSKILKTFVRENYRYHLSEILATIVNEYTDWERPVQHPINIRDETLEALSDAMYVAPAIHTADLHSASRRNSYLYVFDYQTKFGDFPQRQGCIHGEELPYIFGAPLVGGLSHFTKNYTKSETLLSEATMIYWSNFARTGNPNEPQEPDLVHGVRQERNRFKNIEWTAYEAVHKKYLNLDTKPKVKNHFRAHRLSFWLKLVPDLHRPGGEDVPRTHHLLSEDEIQDSLVHTHDVGKVRAGIQQMKKPVDSGTVIEVTGKQGTVTGKINLSQLDPNNTENVILVRGLHPLDNIISDNAAASASASATPPQQEDGFAAYSTALSVTIAIGCSLLIVNVLIFAGVYYQRDKNRLSRHHHHDGGNGSTGSNNSIRDVAKTKKIIENGIPNSICGDILLNADVCKSNDPGGGAFGHIHHHIHHQLPPPEFADLPNNANLPRAPPPPKQQKLIPCGVPKVQDPGFGTLPRTNLQSSLHCPAGTLPRSMTVRSEQEPVQALHVLNPTGTLTKKNAIINSKTNEMDELRV